MYRVGQVGTELPRSDTLGLLIPEWGDAVAELPDGVPEARWHRRPRPLGGRAGGAVAAAEADAGRRLRGERVDLLARPGGASGVVETLGLSQLLAQLGQALSVGGFGRRVQHGPGVALRGDV